jgi:hypothetical protein
MGRERTRSVWDQAPAAQRNGHPNTMRYREPTGSVQSPSPPFGRLGPGLDRPFKMVRWELPKLDCEVEVHFKRGDVSLPVLWQRRRVVMPAGPLVPMGADGWRRSFRPGWAA